MTNPRTPYTVSSGVSLKASSTSIPLADLILTGEDEAYARAAIREASPNEVGGVGRITRHDGWILCHGLLVLKQEVSMASCDFESAIEDWLLTWNTKEAVLETKEPHLDFLIWHVHPITGWSSQDEEWIENYTTAGLLVSLVLNGSKQWESRVDTLVNGIHFTRPGELLVGHPSYKDAETRAIQAVKDNVTVEPVKPLVKSSGRVHYLSPSVHTTFLDEEADDDLMDAAGKRAAAPVNSDEDRESAFLRFLTSDQPKAYFMESGMVALHDASSFLVTVNCYGNTKAAANVRSILKDAGITKRMQKTYRNSAVLLTKTNNDKWAAQQYGGI